MPSAAGADERQLLGRYVSAFEDADMAGLVALLRQDATLRMPPQPSLVGGLAIARFFLEAIELFDRVPRGDPHWLSIQFMKSQKIDRVAAALLLESFEDAFLDWLQAFTMPTLVVCGSEDDDNGSAEELAAALPNATFVEIPGTHMSSVTKPELSEAIAQFLVA